MRVISVSHNLLSRISLTFIEMSSSCLVIECSMPAELISETDLPETDMEPNILE